VNYVSRATVCRVQESTVRDEADKKDGSDGRRKVGKEVGSGDPSIRFHGDDQRKGASSPRATIKFDDATVHGCKASSQRQSEARSFVLASKTTIELFEEIKDTLVVLRRDSGASVRNGQMKPGSRITGLLVYAFRRLFANLCLESNLAVFG